MHIGHIRCEKNLYFILFLKITGTGTYRGGGGSLTGIFYDLHSTVGLMREGDWDSKKYPRLVDYSWRRNEL